MARQEETDAELECIKIQLRALRLEMRRQTELLDTISSPPWKRLWFFLQGFRLWRLGVWYRAPWNVSAWQDEDQT